MSGAVAPAVAAVKPSLDAARSALEQMQAKLQADVEAVKKAAADWGLAPDHPEHAFVSALIGAQASFAQIACTWGEYLGQVAAVAREAALVEVKLLHDRNEAANVMLRRIDAKQAGMEIERDRLIVKFVKEVAPMVADALKDAIVLRERGHHRRKAWKQVAAILGWVVVASGCTFALGSFRHADAAAAVNRCVAAKVLDGQGRAYCPFDALAPGN